MKLACLLFLLTVSAMGQCDTICPSGKVLFTDPGEWVTLKGDEYSIAVPDTFSHNVYPDPNPPRRITLSNDHRVRIDTPCTVVKKWGCPVDGCEQWEERQYVVSVFVERGELSQLETSSYAVCMLCGTYYNVKRARLRDRVELYYGRRKR